MLNRQEIVFIENFLVAFYDIFARHRFYIGVIEEFIIKLTPKDNSPAYTQSQPTPVNHKDDTLVELALLHKYGIIRTLPFSKYASPISAQKNPNGKLRLLVDLKKINNLIPDDYINNNHPVSTLTDAAQHHAGKIYFANWTARKPIIVYKWLTKGQLNHSISQAGLLRTGDLRKDSADHCLPSPTLCGIPR